nr:hypothetical protein [Tanacetum cinerariifolium]
MAYSTPSASSSDFEVSDDEKEEVEMQEIKPSLNRIIFVKATTDNNPKEKVKTGEQPNTHRKRAVNDAKAKAKYNAAKGNRGNAVKDLACWVWKPKQNILDHVSRHISASITLKKFNYVDARGRSNAKTTSWNEFSNTMASTIICLDDNQKFNFSKYILDNLKKNLEAGVPFYMFPRFIQVFINHQICDLSHHKGIYVNPSLTKKVFANMKKVGTGFSGAVIPLFGIMMVQAVEEVGDLPTTVQDIPISDAPSSSQPYRKHKPRRKERKETKVSPTELHIKDHVLTTSNDPLPSGEDNMQLKELMVLCTNWSNKVLDLENKVIEIKSSHKTNIAELESRVEKLKEENMSLTNELKSFNTKVKSPANKETIVDKEKSSKQGRKFLDIDADAEVNLENVYNLDMAHKETVLCMQDVTDADVKEVAKEMVEVVTTAKIIINEVSIASGEHNATNEEPVSVAPTNLTTAQPNKATKTTVKDKGKAKLVEEPKVLKSRKAQIAIDEEVSRRIEAEWNADIKDNIDWNERISYEEIRPLFEEEYNKVQTLFKEGLNIDAERIKDSRKRTRKEKVEKDQTVKKQKGDELKQDNIEKQKLEEQQEAKELKRNLEIVPDDEDDVFVNVTPLSSKPPTIVDYKIYKEERMSTFK